MKTTLIALFIFYFQTNFLFGQKTVSEEQKVFQYLFKDIKGAWLNPSLDTNEISSIRHHIFLFPYYADYKRITKDSSIIVDSVVLNDFENIYIDSCIKGLKNQRFTKADKLKSGLVGFKLLGSDKDTRKRERISFTYQIMKPIFIRNKTVCFVYYNYGECGGLCGYMELSVLKKLSGEWKHLMTLNQYFD